MKGNKTDVLRSSSPPIEAVQKRDGSVGVTVLVFIVLGLFVFFNHFEALVKRYSNKTIFI